MTYPTIRRLELEMKNLIQEREIINQCIREIRSDIRKEEKRK